jgi:hypothetical protein
MTDVDLIHIYEECASIGKNKQSNKDEDDLTNSNKLTNYDLNSVVLSQNDNESYIINKHTNINDSLSERHDLSSIITAANAFERLSRQYSLTFSSRSQSIIRNRFNNINNQSLNINNNSANNAAAAHDDDGSSSINSASMNLTPNEPIIIRGDGNITIFGIFNRFSREFPAKLAAKIAPEEYRDTITNVNIILKKELTNSLKWLIFGSICCCCTFGMSLLPVFYINKKAKLAINKLLNIENERIYKKLGIKWRLAKQKLNSGSLLEYVIVIDIMPSLLIYEPD